MTRKFKWKVQEVPKGRYSSFEQRGWPFADSVSGEAVAAIFCEDEYDAKSVKAGSHGPLTVQVADHTCAPFKWRTLKERFATLDAAKAIVDTFFAENPEMFPSM